MVQLTRSSIAFVLLIVVLLVLIWSNIKYINDETARVLAEKAARDEARASGKEISETSRVEMSPPTHVPIYTEVEFKGKPRRMVADYTSVPSSIGRRLKVAENPRNLIIDRKIVYYGTGRTTSYEHTDKEAKVFDPKTFTPALAEAMAEKKLNVEVIEWIKSLTTAEIGDIFRETQATIDRINQELIAQGKTLQTLEDKYSAEQDTIASMNNDDECNDFDGNCTRWRENNDCIINTAYMFDKCPSACGLCGLSPEQIQTLQEIYGDRGVPNCMSTD